MLPTELTIDPLVSFGAGSVPDSGAEVIEFLTRSSEVTSLPAVVLGNDSFESFLSNFTYTIHLFDLIGGEQAYGEAEFVCEN